MKPDIVILSATPIEAGPILSRIDQVKTTETRSGNKIYTGQLGKTRSDLLLTGPGVFNAAHALTAYFESLEPELWPDLVLQTGIAGVFRESGLKVGDLAVATKEHYVHTGVASGNIIQKPLPFPLVESVPSSRSGMYYCSETLTDPIIDRLRSMKDKLNGQIVPGFFITVSTITASFKSATQIYSEIAPVMESMEGAASAHISAIYNVSFVQIRGASNFTGDRNKSNWQIDLAAENVAHACHEVFKNGFFLNTTQS